MALRMPCHRRAAVNEFYTLAYGGALNTVLYFGKPLEYLRLARIGLFHASRHVERDG
jgi:hypothetical protein